MMDYADIELNPNLTKEIPSFQDIDAKMEDESLRGEKVVRKTIHLNRLYGQDLEIGGSSNISGRILMKDSSNRTIVKIDSVGLHNYFTTGEEVARMDNSGFSGYDVGGIRRIGVSYGGLTVYDNTGIPMYGMGEIGLYFYLENATAIRWLNVYPSVAGHAEIGFDHPTNTLYLSSVGLINLGNVGGATAMSIDTTTSIVTFAQTISGTIANATNATNASYATDAEYVKGTGGRKYFIDYDGIGDIVIYRAAGDGPTSKTAIVPTSQGYNALYCMESPEVWFMDFCESKDKIDPLFLEVTSSPYHFIKCEDGEYQVWGKRKGLESKRFEEKTKKEFERNNEFWSIPLLRAG